MTLKEKTVKGVLWSGLEQFTTVSIQFICTIFIARVLSPEEFGIVGMIAVFIAISQVILDGGFNITIIRSEKLTNIEYSTIFYTNILLSILMYCILFIASPFIAQFYEEPILESISKVAFLVLPINAIGLVQYTLLNKKLNFKALSIISITSAIVSGIVGIYLAYTYINVWALVFQNISFFLTRTILLWIMGSWMPIFKYSYTSIRKILPFSIKVLLSRIIGSVFDNSYKIIIGKFFSATELGFYTQADRFQKVPTSTFLNIIQRVTFPILSEMKSDNERLKEGYLKILGLCFYMIAPIMMYAFVVSSEIFDILLSPKWHQASVYFRYLCIIGIFYPISSINLSILNIKGNGSLILNLEIVRKVMLVIIIVITIQFNMTILLYGAVLYSILQLILNTYFSGKQIGITLWMQLKNLLHTIIILLASVLLCLYISSTLINYSSLSIIIITFFIYSFLFIILSVVTKNKHFIEILSIIKQKMLK